MYASQIGVDILKAGGNAVDAAVATVFAIGVAEPEMSGVGGCGLMNVYLAKDNKRSILDFMETTPLASHPGMIDVKNPADIYSGKNVAVPGQVHGLLTALEKYGTMTPEQVIAPAIKLAQDGYLVDKNLYDFIG
ncbi:MAG: gamma-glutamyltransferase, partial [Oscillospiraceae bacterium]